jgi:hypothetical protein
MSDDNVMMGICGSDGLCSLCAAEDRTGSDGCGSYFRAGTARPGLSITTIEITHPQGFGDHEFEYDAGNDLFKCTHCGGYEIALRNPETGEIPQCPGPERTNGGVDHA